MSVSICPFNPSSDEDTTLSAKTLAKLFGCEDDSYGRTLAAYRDVLARPEFMSDRLAEASINDLARATEVHRIAGHQMANTTALFRELPKEEPSSDNPVWSEFCHLYLPAFIRAFRETIKHGARSAMNGPVGTDDHVWYLLRSIVETPIFSRYVRDHEQNSQLLVDAIGHMTVMVGAWSKALKANRDWRRPICGGLELHIEALLSLIFVFPPDRPSTIYPLLALTSPVAQTLRKSLFALKKTLSRPPRNIDTTAAEHVESLTFVIEMLTDCLDGQLSHGCAAPVCPMDARKIRANSVWNTCGGRSDVKRCETKPEEFLLCARCRAVRYCSHAHQKAHWKMHKRICKEPIW